MTYKDMTFCAPKIPCLNTKCFRNKSEVPSNIPYWQLVSYSDFSDTCKDYDPSEKDEVKK